MGNYVAISDLQRIVSKEFLIQLTDDEGNLQQNDLIASGAIINSEALVNGFLAQGGYTVPVATPIPAGAEVIKAASMWLSA